MAHTIYTTDAIVLHKAVTGEADLIFWLLTQDLGLIVAHAQGVRKSTAKMRGHLQLFSVLKVSLVKGRSTWRITGTDNAQGGFLDTLQLCGEALGAFARICGFVRRMIMANTQNALELFGIVKHARVHLAGISNNHQNNLITKTVKQDWTVKDIEINAVAEILVSLGYIEVDILRKIKEKEISHNELVKVVNNAIAASHL